jgi:hypothetical protein
MQTQPSAYGILYIEAFLYGNNEKVTRGGMMTSNILVVAKESGRSAVDYVNYLYWYGFRMEGGPFPLTLR